jgi:hypothetical protein
LQHGGAVIFDPCSRSDLTPPLVAADIQSGRVVWAADAGRGPKKYSACDVSGACFRHNGRSLIAYPTYRFLLCADASTGRRLWEIPETGVKNLTPCYSDGRLLWDPPGRVQMLRLSNDASTYEVLWTRHSGIHSFSHAVVLDGRAYLFGNPYMRTRTPDEQASSPVEEGIGYVFAAPETNNAPESVRTNGPRAVAEWQRQAQRETHLLCLDADTGRLIHSRPAAEPGHIIAADGMVYVLELLHQGPDKPVLPRVSLIRPTAGGFETAGTLVPPFDAQELCWDSHRTARNEQHKQWAREDFIFQKNVNPVIAEGRLFLRYGPLQVYDLRGKDWKPQPTAPVRVSRDPDLTFTNAVAAAESAPEEARPLLAAFASRYLDERTNAVATLAALPPERHKSVTPAAVRMLDVGGDRAWLVQQAAIDLLRSNAAATATVAQSLADRVPVALDDRNGHLAERLFTVLRDVNPAAATQAVASAGLRLSSDDAGVRRQALMAIGSAGPLAAAAAPPLAYCLGSSDGRLANGAAAVLRGLGPAAGAGVPALQSALIHAIGAGDAARTQLAGDTLRALDSNAVAACSARMADFVAGADHRVAGLALQVLNSSGALCPQAVHQLVAGLKSGDMRMAEESAAMLGRLGPQAKPAIEALIGYLGAETGAVRVVAAGLLGRIGPAAGAAVEPLAAGLGVADLPFARACAVSLGRIGAAAAPASARLAAAAGWKDTELARCATAAIGAIGRASDDAAEQALVAALRHGDESVRTNSVAALRQIGRDPVPHLLAILKGRDKRMAAWAAMELGKLGADARAAIPALILALSDAALIPSAVEALGGIGREAAATVPDLLALSRVADSKMGPVIQKALDNIKTANESPSVADVTATCREGGTVVVSLPVSDPDDVLSVLVASIAQDPAHGTLARLSNTQFLYRADWGTTSEDVFIWGTADRGGPSRKATATIFVTPDRTPPAVRQVFVWTNTPSVRLEFDEPLLAAAATDVRNYRIEPDVSVKGAQVDSNGMGVWLQTGPVVEGQQYTIRMSGLRDRSRAGKALKAEVTAKCLAPGLLCAYHETEAGSPAKQAFGLGTPRTNAVVARIDCAVRQREENFSLMFVGMLRTERAGDHTFWLKADDYAWLNIGTNLVAQSSGAREAAGTFNLSAGLHPFYIMYTQTTGTNILEAAWSGPGFRRQPIPPTAMYHQ